MKILQTLLFGCAAALVAVSAAQAAELHGNAKVDHAKSCSHYGAGFRQVPGSDLCMKIGGWVRTEATTHGNGNINWDALNANDRATSTTARGYITTDVRQESGYGTVRGYVSVGVNRQ
jgi:hypothetical protein